MSDSPQDPATQRAESVKARWKALGQIAETCNCDISEVPKMLAERAARDSARAEARAKHARDSGWGR